jgi:hypothetical protein
MSIENSIVRNKVFLNSIILWLNLETFNIVEKESINIKNSEKCSILNIFDEYFIGICRGLLF